MPPLHADGRTLADVLLVFLAVAVMPAASILAGRRLDHAQPQSLVPRYWKTMARGWVIAALLIGVWLWQKRPLGELGLDIPVGMWGRAGFAMLGVIALVMAFQILRLARIATGDRLANFRRQAKVMKITPRNGSELAVFVLTALTAGVWEELLYRGFLLWFLIPLTGVVPAVLISSAVFGLGHLYQGWQGVPVTGLIGLVFAVAYLLSGSLWWVMAAHALLDIFGGFVSWRMSALARAAAPQSAPA